MFNAQSLLAPFVPAQFKPLLACVSPNAFKVIEWKKILAEAPSLAKRVATGEGVSQLAESVTPLLPKEVKLRMKDSEEGSSTGKTNLLQKDGFTILEIYFAQFKNDEGIFLDLRPSNFSSESDGSISWRPNGLWKLLSKDFREGMLAVYEGYYLDKPARLRQGLLQVGLIKENFSPTLVTEVEGMILGHIGGSTTNQQFKVAHFTASFERLFQFLLKEKIVLHPDFLYLGMYLASLYIHLESLGGSYDVRRAFLGEKTN